jgi:molybdate transport system substrate-binding protein
MKKNVVILLVAIGLLGCAQNSQKEALQTSELMIYVGAASKPPVEEIVAVFEKETGIRVDVVFGGSGFILSQMKLTSKGDIYFPGSSDYMEIAKREKLVYPESEQQVAYLASAINVQKGNPKNILELKDLCKPGVKVAIANPEGVCVGSYAVEILEKNLTKEEIDQFRKNCVTFPESCDKTAAVIAMKTVDAVIGWSVFQHWNPELIETVALKPDELIRIGYIPIAISTFSSNQKMAQQFIDFVQSENGKRIFEQYHYFNSPEKAMEWIGKELPVGGEYVVPDRWLNK